MAIAKKQKVTVRSVGEKFRRLGEKFTSKAREIEVTSAQLKTLKAEPMLVVNETKSKGR